MPDAFVSYAREDQTVVRRLHDALEGRGKELWVDWEGIAPSDRWMDSIREAIDDSDAVVCCLSPDALHSLVCLEELTYATARGKRLIPVVCRDVDGADVPHELAELNWIFLREDDNFDAGVESVVRALETDLDVVRMHTRLLTRARSWEASGQRRASLLRGEDLQAAEAWLARGGGGAVQPTEFQIRFVEESRRAARRRQRLAMAGSLGVAAVSIGLAVFAVLQRNEANDQRDEARSQARIALSRALAVEAEAAFDGRLDAGLLLALEAIAAAPTSEARASALTAIQRTAHLQTTARIPEAAIAAVAFSDDGRSIAVASTGGRVLLWSIPRRRVIGEFRLRTSEPAALDVSPDGTALAASGWDDVVELWSLKGGLAGELLSNPAASACTGGATAVPTVAFSRSGNTLAWGRLDATIVLWDIRAGVQDGPPLPDPSGECTSVSALAWSPTDPDLLFAGYGRGIVVPWNVTSRTAGQAEFLSGGSDGSFVADIAFAPGEAGWAAAVGGLIWTFPGGITASHEGGTLGVVFAAGGARVVSAGNDGTLRAWGRGSGLAPTILRGHGEAVRIAGIGLAPDGENVVSVGSDGLVLQWDVAAGGAQLVRGLNDAEVMLPGGRPLDGLGAVAFGPDGELATTDPGTGTIVLYDGHGRISTRIGGSGVPPATLAYLPDGHTVVAAGGGDDEAVLWDTSSGREVGRLESFVNSVDVSPDGTLLVSAGDDGTVRLWDAETLVPWSAPLRGHEGGVRQAVFSPDGQLVASASFDGTVRLWDVATGRSRAVLRDERGAGDVAFSLDGAMIASSRGADITLWSVANARALGEPLSGHSDRVTDLAFGPGGVLASSSADGTVRLWETRTRRTLGEPLRGHDADLVGLAFSPDGRTLASEDATGRVLLWSSGLWDLGASDWRGRLCRAAGRNLTQSEWREFLPDLPYRRTCGRWPAGT